MVSQNDTATIVLMGQILLPEFARTIGAFGDLIDALQTDYGNGQRIEWAMDDLQSLNSDEHKGSASASTRGLWQDDRSLLAVESVVQAYETVGLAVRDHRPLLDFSPRVQKPARALERLINGHIKSLRFETVRQDVDVYAPSDLTLIPATVVDRVVPRISQPSFGSVRGRVESMSRRNGLRFTLYDLNEDAPVGCYLERGQESKMREFWGRVVVVEGRVRRDPISGRPTAIREITDIQLVPEGDSWNFKKARGASGWRIGDLPAEKAIRLVRDG